ncbi:hypothetical protein ANCDUO_26303, partial [Ancylostoma duodenale]
EVKLGVCDTCTGKFSDEFRLTALDMHNYYRRLVATGWAKTGDKYAETATKMIKLEYDKALEDDAIKEASNCATSAKGGPYNENFWYTKNFKTPHVEGFKE